MRAADCNAMLQLVPLTTTETNHQENHYHTAHFLFSSTFGNTATHCRSVNKQAQHHTQAPEYVRLYYYFTGCFQSSGHNEAVWHDGLYITIEVSGPPPIEQHKQGKG